MSWAASDGSSSISSAGDDLKSMDLSVDFNRDGVNDIAMMSYDSGKGIWQVKFYDVIRGTVLGKVSDDSLHDNDNTFGVGDLTGDGIPDVVLGDGYSNGGSYGGGEEDPDRKDYPGQCIIVKDGGTGAEIYKSKAATVSSGCGEELQVVDLDRDGRSEVVVSELIIFSLRFYDVKFDICKKVVNLHFCFCIRLLWYNFNCIFFSFLIIFFDDSCRLF